MGNPDEQPKRRKRGRRGGRRRRRRGGEGDNNQNGAQATESDTPADDTAKAADQNDGASAPDQASDGDADAKPAKAARGGRGRGRRAVKSDDTGSQVEGETTQSSEAGGSGDNDGALRE